MWAVNRLGFLIMVMLALTAVYFVVTTMFTPSKPQVVVVRPSEAQGAGQGNSQPGAPTPAPAPPPAGGINVCPKAMFLKVKDVTVCADVLYSVVRTDGSLQVDFQEGVVQGNFMFLSAPSCPVATTPHGALFIPCRAQILIPIR